MQTLEKKELSFKEICDELDSRKEKYLKGKSKTYSVNEVWEKLKNRNTFLTKK